MIATFDDRVNRPASDPNAWHDPLWRINNLYFQINKDGERFQFRMREGMWLYLFNRHYRNLILKARQYGFTTSIGLLYLDEAIFIQNHKVGFVAHTMDAAEAIFRDKIIYAWDHLGDLGEDHPERNEMLDKALAIKEAVGVKKQNTQEIIFGQDSYFRVGTSFRSGRYIRGL